MARAEWRTPNSKSESDNCPDVDDLPKEAVMGYLRATEMISFAGLEAALYDHFRYNCYPPLPLALTSAAKEAIERVSRDDDTPVRMPLGISHRRYGNQVPPIVMVEELHLEVFVDPWGDSDV